VRRIGASVSRLWQLPNAHLTPHISGESFPENIVNIFVDNYLRFEQQRSLKYVIDFKLGY
jgi:phosphoglycerate dehydrogenase-like enzyme